LFTINIVGNLGAPSYSQEVTKAISVEIGKSLSYNLPSITDPDKEDKVTAKATLGQAGSFTTFSGRALSFKIPSDNKLGGKSYSIKIVLNDNNAYKALSTSYTIKLTIPAPPPPPPPPPAP
jgi:hypothetical protein